MEAVIQRTPASAAARGDRPGEGHGRRLTAAFEALENFPVLSESRNRVLRLVREAPESVGDVVAAVESDVALVTTVLRVANQMPGKTHGQGGQRAPGRRGAHPRGRGAPRLRRQRVRLLRADPGLGRSPRALSPARRGHPGRGGARGTRSRLPRARRAAGLRAAPRHRQARAAARLPRLPQQDPRRGPHPGGAGARRAPRARCGPRPGGRSAGPPLGPAGIAGRRHRAPPRRGRHRPGRDRAPGRHARPLRPRRARRSQAPPGGGPRAAARPRVRCAT